VLQAHKMKKNVYDIELYKADMQTVGEVIIIIIMITPLFFSAIRNDLHFFLIH